MSEHLEPAELSDLTWAWLDSDTTKGIEWLTPTVETILTDRLAAVTARAEAAEAKVARIEALAERGVGFDMTPTMPNSDSYPAWSNYLHRFDKGWRDNLRAALADEGDTDE